MIEYNKEYFEKKFESLQPKEATVIALRSAMRVLPVLAYKENVYDENEVEKTLLLHLGDALMQSNFQKPRLTHTTRKSDQVTLDA
jgi:hypothetical protein